MISKKSALVVVLAALAMSAHAESYFLTVAGLGGEAEFESRFSDWAKQLDKIYRADTTAKVDTLSGAEATKANIEAKLRALAATKPDDQVVVTLIGHGTFDDREYKLALPGPDISATDLGLLLDKIPARQLVVDMTTSSGGAIPILQKSKRVVIAATKAGTEKSSVAIFPRYWIEALMDPATDANKNDAISALEAFRYAQTKVTKFFETQNRLATEHAVIEDMPEKARASKIPRRKTARVWRPQALRWCIWELRQRWRRIRPSSNWSSTWKNWTPRSTN